MSKLLEHYSDDMGRITDEASERIGGTIVPPGAARSMPVEEVGDSSAAGGTRHSFPRRPPMPKRGLPAEVRLRLLVAKALLAYAEVAALTKA